MSGNKMTNIEVYRKKWHFNIGIFIFGVIFIYLAATVLLYLTGNHVSIYEVREGSIQKDTAYTGLILREETVVTADTSGYVNYFPLEGSKVGAQTKVYCMTPDKLEFKSSGSEEDTQALSAEEQASVLQQTRSFSDSFDSDKFSDVYALKDRVSTILESKSTQSRQAQLDQMVIDGSQQLQIYNAATDGIILFSTDGCESVTMDTVTEDMISKADYKASYLQNNTYVNAGDPVYKLVRSDLWHIVLLLDDETAEELKENSSVSIKFSKDNQTAVAKLEIKKKGKQNYAFLTLDSSMIRYASDRYVDIELILEDQSGLKIPKSSVIKKDFYTVPEDYLSKNGSGVLIDDGSDSANFQEAEVYYRDNENGMIYLDADALKEGTVLRKEDSEDTYALKVKETLRGVYNINKGYAEFRQVWILCESDEYYIVESGSDYSLSNYDHIALSGEGIHENDVVF